MDLDLRQRLFASDLAALTAEARALCAAGHGRLQTYSPKVFIPLTKLCRNVCHYCVFAHPPRAGERSYLSIDEVVAIAEAGARVGCKEALFTLGDKPELRYAAARRELEALGCATTIDYIERACEAVLKRTGLLPHVNAGVMTRDDLKRLQRVSASQGLMLESASARLCEKGGAHFGSPDKAPAARLETIALAGELAIPFTSGILIGIGETRAERLDALCALRDLNARYGHIQEIIVQNFRAKPGTRMADAMEPDTDDLVWTIAAARIVFGADMSIQAPPNLSPGAARALLDAGINDWGGVSPVTPDHVNPEAPWPEVAALRGETEAAGKHLVERLTIYPRFVHDAPRWLDPKMTPHVLRVADSEGLARMDVWSPGARTPFPIASKSSSLPVQAAVAALCAKASAGEALSEQEIVSLFAARGADFEHVCESADRLRARVSGETISYVVTRNINYTNVCLYACEFCAFSKGRGREALRGPAYDLDLAEVARRAREAWERGAVEVCMQGGIHPSYTGETYLELLRNVREAAPGIHVHAFSPLEVSQGAATLGLDVEAFLKMLRAEGLGSLPGTAAEILDDEVRAIICPDKLNTDEWLDVVATAHRVGLRTTATIMFGHVDAPVHWARHLLRIRAQQAKTGGFTEFVPLPFVHDEAPLYLKGRARKGPTARETILMHAIARLALNPLIPNIQVSWVKLGREGARACLQAGVNDLGGTLMNESISRAAGAAHGEEMPPEAMEALIQSLGRTPRQRATLYADAPPAQQRQSFGAEPLSPIVLTPARKRARRVEDQAAF